MIRRVNQLGADNPDLADLAEALRQLLGAPPDLRRGLSLAERKQRRG
jgi:hypothetical protein